ncbi:MAG: pentapeptide repeat-containing protein [Rubrivivax sp.]|nr:pentapeptide repeat-containing protein [Rubrivivax sp.]
MLAGRGGAYLAAVLPAADFAGAVLAGAFLAGADFAGAFLAGAFFAGAAAGWRAVVFFAAGAARLAAGLACMACSTFTAAFLAPVAAAFTCRFTARSAWTSTFWPSALAVRALLFTVRSALPSAFFASTSTACTLRCIFTLAVCAVFSTTPAALRTSRLASAAAPSARLAIDAPTFCAFDFADSTASPSFLISDFSLALGLVVAGTAAGAAFFVAMSSLLWLWKVPPRGYLPDRRGSIRYRADGPLHGLRCFMQPTEDSCAHVRWPRGPGCR